MTIKVRLILMMIAVLSITAILFSCASVPKEAVELSYTVGEDIEAVHLSYRALISQHFQNLRAQANQFLDQQWTPSFLKDFIEKGELQTYCQDRDPVKAFDGVSLWVEAAIEEIGKKRKGLLDPIDQDEKMLIASVDEAFARLVRANAIITAHLNSLRKVQEVQDEALKSLKLKDMRDKINQQFITASERAEDAIQKIQKAEKPIQKLGDKLRK